ncbi:hypothetical protein [Deinococcus altitudinis]|uniref:hypothetical protein n=1 Tax=Deinococcus altitudinis TaxID=468914 RepID=UPI003891DBE7
MTVRAGTAARRDVHVDEGEGPGGVLATEQDGVGVAHQADVRHVRAVGTDMGQRADQVVGGQGSVWFEIAHAEYLRL